MHTIRLRGPWHVEPVARFLLLPNGTYQTTPDDLPPAARVTMPADWAVVCGGDFLGRVRYHRIFQKPTGLDSGEQVFLVVEAPRSLGVVSLNHRSLGIVAIGDVHLRINITAMLDDHNHLEIVVDHPSLDAAGTPNDDGETRLPGGLVGEVRLEIED